MSIASHADNRRAFIKKSLIATAPMLLPYPLEYSSKEDSRKIKSVVNFIYDGLALGPRDYIEKLQTLNQKESIAPDFYGQGGVVEMLEQKFAEITGKEQAIYLPTGTMANQLAIKLLNNNKGKVIVPDNAHIYRDESDAAQRVHGIRLIPCGQDKPYFDQSDLDNTIQYTSNNEVFDSGLGTVVLENPVRRADGTVVPIQTIQEISAYCKERGLKRHLDGARIHLASAFSGVSVQEYSSYFDTVYISLYKYLNASGGAILCGDKEIISQVPDRIKILGGTVFQSWQNAAIALDYLNDIDKRMEGMKYSAHKLIDALNKSPYLQIEPIVNGSNVFNMRLDKGISLKLLANHLNEEHSIWLGRANEEGLVKLRFNESILLRDVDELASNWLSSIDQIK